MKYLLDTHALLWSLCDTGHLSPVVLDVICSPQNQVWVSAISFWEISLKHALGKLDLNNICPEQLPGFALQQNFQLLPLSAQDAAGHFRLSPSAHRDPFDRMLAWQAIQNQMVLVTKDKLLTAAFTSSGLVVLW